MRLAAAAAVLAALLGLAPLSAEAGPNQPLERARHELEELRYGDALKSLERALRVGNSSPGQLVEIYRLLGEVRASLGQPARAIGAFERALAIDPDVSIDRGVSPRIRKPFVEAKERAAEKGPIQISHELREEPRMVVLQVESDPHDMTAGGRAIFWTESDRSVEVIGKGSSEIELVVPDGAVSFAGAIVDEFDNRLAEIGRPSDRVPLVETKDQVVEDEDGDGDEDGAGEGPGGGTPIYEEWWAWGGLAAGFAGAAAAFGVSAQGSVDDIQERVDESQSFEFAEVKRLEDRARERALLSNIGWGLAGACAAAAVYFFVTEDEGDGGPEEPPEAAVTPSVSGDSVGVKATLTF